MKYQSYLLMELITHSLMRNTFFLIHMEVVQIFAFGFPFICLGWHFCLGQWYAVSSFFVIYVNGIMADSARSTASHGEFIQPPGRGPATSHCRLGWLGSKIQLKQQHSGGCFNETHEIYGNVYVSFCGSPWSSPKDIMGICLGFIGGYS